MTEIDTKTRNQIRDEFVEFLHIYLPQHDRESILSSLTDTNHGQTLLRAAVEFSSQVQQNYKEKLRHQGDELFKVSGMLKERCDKLHGLRIEMGILSKTLDLARSLMDDAHLTLMR